MYFTFTAMLVVTGIRMMSNGHVAITQASGNQTEHWNYSMGLVPFVSLVFLLGCAMGIGKAAVYKHIPEYFPSAVGPVGGLVHMLHGESPHLADDFEPPPAHNPDLAAPAPTPTASDASAAGDPLTTDPTTNMEA